MEVSIGLNDKQPENHPNIRYEQGYEIPSELLPSYAEAVVQNGHRRVKSNRMLCSSCQH